MRTITVKGVGSLSVKPDYINVLMDVSNLDRDYDKVMQTANQDIVKLKDQFECAGFDKKTIKTTNFNVTAEYKSSQDRHGQYTEVFAGYKCSHGLKLAFDFDAELLSKAIKAIEDSKTKPKFRIQFTIKHKNDVDINLLKSATKNAHKKAEVLCGAAGVQLKQLLTIDYNWNDINVYSKTDFVASGMLRGGAPAKMLQFKNIEPENIDVTDSASFVWEIE